MAEKPFLRKDGNESPEIGINLEDLSSARQAVGSVQGGSGPQDIDDKRFMLFPAPPNERRRWKRFRVDGAVVMAHKPSRIPGKKPSHVRLGPVKDIGMKGLAFHYVEKNPKVLEKIKHLSIVFPGEGVIVDKVPFKIVNELKAAELPGQKEVRTICIAFGRLMPMQKLQLEIFIDRHGTELKKTPSPPQ